jgi:hypothetical protein
MLNFRVIGPAPGVVSQVLFQNYISIVNTNFPVGKNDNDNDNETRNPDLKSVVEVFLQFTIPSGTGVL